jgi:hypothetical protein
VEELLTDRGAYDRESAASREAALSFVNGLDAGSMARLLCSLRPRTHSDVAERSTIESLTPDKRALLLERLRKRGTAG